MTSTQELLQLIQQLPAGDQVRLLNFARAMITQRQGKRQKRAVRYSHQADFHSHQPNP